MQGMGPIRGGVDPPLPLVARHGTDQRRCRSVSIAVRIEGQSKQTTPNQNWLLLPGTYADVKHALLAVPLSRARGRVELYLADSIVAAFSPKLVRATADFVHVWVEVLESVDGGSMVKASGYLQLPSVRTTRTGIMQGGVEGRVGPKGHASRTTKHAANNGWSSNNGKTFNRRVVVPLAFTHRANPIIVCMASKASSVLSCSWISHWTLLLPTPKIS